MRISKEKLAQLKKRTKSAARGAVAGSKSTLYEGAAGAAASYAEALLKKNFNMIGSRPWAGGAALVAVGHFLKRSKKFGTVGAAVCGAGGYSLGIYLQARRAAAASAPEAAAPVSQTQGVYPGWPQQDTGIVFTSAAERAA